MRERVCRLEARDGSLLDSPVRDTVKFLVQPPANIWPFIGNSVISLCFGAQFIDHGFSLAIPTRRYFIDILCELPFGREDLQPTHRFEENYLGYDDLETFRELLRTCPDGSRISFLGWFQKKSAFLVSIHSLIQRFFPIRQHWFAESDRLLSDHGVDLKSDLILNIRGRDYKQEWGGANYVGVDWARKAVDAFDDSVRRVFLVSDDDDVPILSAGRPIIHLSRDHNQFLDFCILARARNVIIPKSSFSFVAVMATSHQKRVLYPDRWLLAPDYSHQMVDMLDETPFIEKVRLPGY